MRSFIKYPGGKNHIYPFIKEILPKNFNNYHEPFVGSGSIFLNLTYELELFGKCCYLSDKNPQLVLAWQVIKNRYKELVFDIESLSSQFSEESFYYALRDMDRLPYFDEPGKISDIRKAARFIILNKLGFNGLVRNSKKGFCNVPWGKKAKNFGFFKEPQYEEIFSYLQKTTINCCDYKTAFDGTMEKGDLVYLDPPYIPSQKKGFTGYYGQWGDNDHRILSETLKELDGRGVYWILSGHDEPKYQELYLAYNKKSIPVRRNIAANKENRKTIDELLIWNY